MEKFNTSFSRILNLVLISLIVLIPIGMGYRIFEMIKLENEGVSAEWASVVVIILLAVEIYLVLNFIWLRLILRRKMNKSFKFIQLLIIFVLGVIPGILAIYPAFFKD